MDVEGNGRAARRHLDRCTAAVWEISGGDGGAHWGAAEDDIAGGEAACNRAHRSDRALQTVLGWLGISDHVR